MTMTIIILDYRTSLTMMVLYPIAHPPILGRWYQSHSLHAFKALNGRRFTRWLPACLLLCILLNASPIKAHFVAGLAPCVGPGLLCQFLVPITPYLADTLSHPRQRKALWLVISRKGSRNRSSSSYLGSRQLRSTVRVFWSDCVVYYPFLYLYLILSHPV